MARAGSRAVAAGAATRQRGLPLALSLLAALALHVAAWQALGGGRTPWKTVSTPAMTVHWVVDGQAPAAAAQLTRAAAMRQPAAQANGPRLAAASEVVSTQPAPSGQAQAPDTASPPWSPDALQIKFPDGELPGGRLQIALRVQVDAAGRFLGAEPEDPAAPAAFVQAVRAAFVSADGDATEATAPNGPPQGVRAWRIEVEFDEAGPSVRWRVADTAVQASNACCTGDPQ